MSKKQKKEQQSTQKILHNPDITCKKSMQEQERTNNHEKLAQTRKPAPANFITNTEAGN